MQAHGPHGRGQTLSLVCHLTPKNGSCSSSRKASHEWFDTNESNRANNRNNVRSPKIITAATTRSKNEQLTSKSCYTSAKKWWRCRGSYRLQALPFWLGVWIHEEREEFPFCTNSEHRFKFMFHLERVLPRPRNPYDGPLLLDVVHWNTAVRYWVNDTHRAQAYGNRSEHFGAF